MSGTRVVTSKSKELSPEETARVLVELVETGQMTLHEMNLTAHILDKGWAVDWDIYRGKPERIAYLLMSMCKDADDEGVDFFKFAYDLLIEGCTQGVIDLDTLKYIASGEYQKEYSG